MAQTLEKILRDATYATRHPDKTAKQRLDQATQAIRQAIEEVKPEYDLTTRGASQNKGNASYWTKKAAGYNKAIDEYYANLMKFIEGEK